MYDHTFYKQVQISRSDMRPHIKWAVSLVILHMITSIFLQALCGYIWVNILTLSPRGGSNNEERAGYQKSGLKSPATMKRGQVIRNQDSKVQERRRLLASAVSG